jgi:DNA-binding CsgD family transcriptional regulator
VLVERRIATVGDYLSNQRITHQYDAAVAAEGIRTVIGVPVVVEGVTRAVVYGALRTTSELGSAVLASVQQASRRVAFDIAVAEETERRMRRMQSSALLDELRRAPAHPEWESVRAAYAELREIAREVGDAGLREKLDSVARQLAGRPAPSAGPPLSAREIDVLALIAVGHSNPEIAEKLEVGRETVKSYLRSALRKLGAHTRTEAVSLARATGQLP